jgi:DNA-directed RNA polymerase specialized sigma24 family protein
VVRSVHRSTTWTEDLTLLDQQHAEAPAGLKWDDHHTRTALRAADCQAARWVKHGRRGRADCEDLRQDILLAIVERARHFDASQSNWDAYVTLLARHVVSDRIRADRHPARLSFVAIDLPALDAVTRLTSCTLKEADGDDAGIARRLDLTALLDDLPPAPREILAILMVHQGDVPAAQRASGRSCSAFYRAVEELRLWLRAAGLGIATHPRGKNRERDR